MYSTHTSNDSSFMENSIFNEVKLKLAEVFPEKYIPKAHVITLGCQQNEADSEKILGIAVGMGYAVTASPDDADLILINTCAIREHAEMRALSIIGEMKHLKLKNRNLIIGIGGCMTSQKHRTEQLKHSFPYVDLVFGTASIHAIPDLIYKILTLKKRTFREDDLTGDDLKNIIEGVPIERDNPYRAKVSIMYGCNNFCSYCIVPYVRGRERSRKPDEIINEVRTLASRGYRDITLLGQNVNSYGLGLEEKIDIADLLRELNKIDGDFKLRFMTSHPKDASEKLIKTIAECDKIAKHFHLPVQSGSDSILMKMNRKYNVEKYLSIIASLREHMPDITITSDIIVGFPGETDDDFESTIQLLKQVEFDMIFSFIYSPRVGTPAAKLEKEFPENKIPNDVKKSRFARLLSTQNEISKKRNERHIGKTIKVLSEGISKNDRNIYTGRCDSGKLIHFANGEFTEGKYINVKVTNADTFTIFGEIIK